jgi:hypothetical protein
MKRWVLVLSIAIGALACSEARAQVPIAGGTVRLSWDSCSPLVFDKTMNPGPVQIVASVIGQSTPHQAYQVWIVARQNGSVVLPDAWRFDAAGCQAGRASVSSTPEPPLAASCPPFVPAGVQMLEIKLVQIAPPGLGLFGEWINGLLAVAYPAGVTPDPDVRYHLATFTFDHTFSVPGSATEAGTCGGLDAQMCIAAVPWKVTWLDLQGQEWQFNGVDQANVGLYSLTANDPNGLCNGVIPARPTTWGAIKAQYKR